MPRRFPTATAALLAITIALFFLAPLQAQQQTPFWLGVMDQQQPQQFWRLVTAHLLHTDWNHLLWNAAALVMLASIIEQRSRALLLASVVAGMGFVALWFFLSGPNRYYCGWSGVLNTLLIVALYTLYWPAPADSAAAVDSWRRQSNNAIIAVVALGALLKGLYELHTGTALVSNSLWQPAPGAHLAGLTAGAALVLLALTGRWPNPLTKD